MNKGRKLSTKQINVVVEGSCRLCPYCERNGDYGLSYDSGFDCDHDDGEHDTSRISDDWKITQYDEAMEEWVKSQGTLYPTELSDVPDDPMTIPDWCPLEDAKDKT